MKFTPDQFTDYENLTVTDAEKAHFANQFVTFVESGFFPTLFPLAVYRRLSCLFMFIAHFNRDGFISTYFISLDTILDFVQHIIEYRATGTPQHSFVDVEIALINWLREIDIERDLKTRIAHANESKERAELHRLLKKYANDQLLAAAPHLLEACKYVVQWHREHDSGEGELYGLDFVTTCINAVREAEEPNEIQP